MTQAAEQTADRRIVHQESLSYRLGYEYGLQGVERPCPVSGNPLGEMDYAWGYAHGQRVRADGRAA